MVDELPTDIVRLIEASVIGEKIDDFSVSLNEGNQKGAGYLGSLCFISLKNKKTDEEMHLVLKQVLSSGGPKSLEFNTTVFHNEILFYETIWPRLKELQRFSAGNIFDRIPKCYATVSKEGNEKLLLENLSFQNFHTCVKTETLDRNHMECIFETFGQFHAVSFACKYKFSEKFNEVTEPLKDIFDYFLNGTDFFKNSMKRCFKFIWDNLDPDSYEISNRLRKYVEEGPELYSKIMKYDGRHEVLLHGDCWSNNFLFKTDETGNVTDIRLIDFQMIRKGTPVFDLSYCFYSSASEEALGELDFYLKVYHSSLSQLLETFELDANKIYPFQVLQDEWKQHCKFGFMMGMICWEQKLRYDVGIRDLNKIMDGDQSEMQKPRLFDSEKYRRVTRNVLAHMYHNDFL